MRKGIYFATLLSLSAITLLTVSPQLVGAAALNTAGPGKADTNISEATTIGEGFLSADAAPASANSTAEFTVTPGNLTLDRVPDFQFGDIKTSQLVTKSTTTANLNSSSNDAKTGGTSKGKNAFDGNSDGVLQVTDYRGTNAGWVVYGQITPFTVLNPTSIEGSKTAANGSTLTGNLTLKAVTPTAFDGDNAIPTKEVSVITGDKGGQLGSSTAVWQAAVDTGQGQNNVKFGAGTATLTLKRNAHTDAQTYQATLRWTLANVPAAEVPAG
ncbi:WxL domain-containing protein [Lacticaseibacillus saniviri]|uniref:WxL domain-containing protein n=1 Tax=Lacticaseibacillus saniviri JCM 17471 = DSM 24301 TaxID=1293598 RepID=A0A0R2MTQ7_9LACO|nr:WxL domain-containing protein [Lacticaseibacillus saniviri]KRO16268.1 hypothetical protein IV56_GL001629 [Lacticaseibacillus saniviri JCM 17471 = DSM 24301]MCG4281835.1 WxL domain-containing protein [Lacticaseibacillus saniviri]